MGHTTLFRLFDIFFYIMNNNYLLPQQPNGGVCCMLRYTLDLVVSWWMVDEYDGTLVYPFQEHGGTLLNLKLIKDY